MKKLLVSDYDETFHITREGLSENIESVKRFREAGNIFVIATGRSYMDFKWLEETFGIEYDLLILDHGALIVDVESAILHMDIIPREVLSEMENMLRLDRTKRYFCTSGYEGRVPFDAENIQKINVWYNTEEETAEILEILKTKYADVVNAHLIPPESIEIIPTGSGKEVAVEWVMERFGVSPENVYTVGDGYTDIEMVKKYKGYAVKKCVPELKEVALGEIESVTELIEKIMR